MKITLEELETLINHGDRHLPDLHRATVKHLKRAGDMHRTLLAIDAQLRERLQELAIAASANDFAAVDKHVSTLQQVQANKSEAERQFTEFLESADVTMRPIADIFNANLAMLPMIRALRKNLAAINHIPEGQRLIGKLQLACPMLQF